MISFLLGLSVAIILLVLSKLLSYGLISIILAFLVLNLVEKKYDKYIIYNLSIYGYSFFYLLILLLIKMNILRFNFSYIICFISGILVFFLLRLESMPHKLRNIHHTELFTYFSYILIVLFYILMPQYSLSKTTPLNVAYTISSITYIPLFAYNILIFLKGWSMNSNLKLYNLPNRYNIIFTIITILFFVFTKLIYAGVISSFISTIFYISLIPYMISGATFLIKELQNFLVSINIIPSPFLYFGIVVAIWLIIPSILSSIFGIPLGDYVLFTILSCFGMFNEWKK